MSYGMQMQLGGMLSMRNPQPALQPHETLNRKGKRGLADYI